MDRQSKYGNFSDVMEAQRSVNQIILLFNEHLQLQMKSCQCGHAWSEHEKPKTKMSWDACSFPCLKCDCTEYDDGDLRSFILPESPSPQTADAPLQD